MNEIVSMHTPGDNLQHGMEEILKAVKLVQVLCLTEGPWNAPSTQSTGLSVVPQAFYALVFSPTGNKSASQFIEAIKDVKVAGQSIFGPNGEERRPRVIGPSDNIARPAKGKIIQSLGLDEYVAMDPDLPRKRVGGEGFNHRDLIYKGAITHTVQGLVQGNSQDVASIDLQGGLNVGMLDDVPLANGWNAILPSEGLFIPFSDRTIINLGELNGAVNKTVSVEVETTIDLGLGRAKHTSIVKPELRVYMADYNNAWYEEILERFGVFSKI